MAEYTNSNTVLVAAGQNLPLTETAVKGGCGIVHREGAGIVTLRGTTNQCKARYKVSFGGNIAIPTGGTVEAISVALAIAGEPLNSATATVTPAAVDNYFNVYVAAYIDDNGYSMDGDWRASGTYGHDDMRMDDRGMSYANRGRHYVRGHYSRGGSREMNRCRDYLSDQIRDMMDRDDLSQTDRASLKRALEELQG